MKNSRLGQQFQPRIFSFRSYLNAIRSRVIRSSFQTPNHSTSFQGGGTVLFSIEDHTAPLSFNLYSHLNLNHLRFYFRIMIG